MLPFMKDSDSISAINKPLTGTGETGGMPADSQSCEYLTVSGRGQHVRNTTIFVVVMFVLGIVSLGLMVKKARPQLAQASGSESEEAEIEAAISRLTGVRSEMMNRMDEILSKFSEFSSVEQIDVAELSKNPFHLETLVDDVEETPGDSLQADTNVIIKQRMLKALESLELLSIMNSDQGLRCVIGDRIVTKGEMVREFKVLEVKERQVLLQWMPQDVNLQDIDASELCTVLKLAE
jgi:hypothetical protein